MIFKNLQQQPPDKILALMTAFKEDPRDQKLDLGVGVYKDPTGITPIMRSIKLAEKKWWELARHRWSFVLDATWNLEKQIIPHYL